MSHAAKSYHAVIIADAPAAHLAPYHDLITNAGLLIAADGGARYLLHMGAVPHLAIGDFDSLEPELLAQLEQAGVEIARYPVHKNETDLELALLAAIERGAMTLCVLAALGGRPDQHLANLQLLTHPSLAEIDVRLLHESWEVFAIRRESSISGSPGDTVSLLPMTEEVTGITTEGLFYPLQNDALRLGPARGVSNVLTHTEARVAVRQGILLCMHERKAAAESQ
jgi:thiamine pyrophosphokinase